MKKAMRAMVTILSVGLILLSVCKLYGIYTQYRSGTKLYADVAQQFVSMPTAGQTTQDAPQETPPISVDFAALIKENADVVGWIYCEDTPINHPVLQGEDNSHYLHRMFDGSRNNAGSIFMDCRNDAEFSHHNTLLYGHNMKNGTMFGTLSNYADQAYFDQHPVIWLLTPEQTYRMEVIAGMVAPPDSQAYGLFDAQSALQEHLLRLVEQSDFDAQADVSLVQRVVTLSTCSYEYERARYILVASLVALSE